MDSHVTFNYTSSRRLAGGSLSANRLIVSKLGPNRVEVVLRNTDDEPGSYLRRFRMTVRKDDAAAIAAAIIAVAQGGADRATLRL